MKRWPTKPLGELCDVRIGRTPRRDEPRFWGGDAVWVTIRELNGGEITSSKEMVSEAAVRECMPEPIPTGTLLFSFKLSIGKMAIAGCPLYTNEAIAALPIRKPAELSRDFLRYSLLRESHEGTANTAVMGKVLNKEKVQQLKIPMPPLAEQERIVKLLDEADELRKLRAQADHRAAAFIPALFHEMFGNAGLHCPSATIEEAVEQFIDYRGKTPEKSLNGVPLVTAKIVKGGRILPPTEYIPEENYASWMRRGLPRKGDVLFTMEAPLGEVAMVKDTHIALAQRILLMRPRADILDSCYFMTALKMPCVWKQIEERATGSTVRGIRQAELRKITIPVPPLPLQQEFAQRVSEIRELETAQAASRQRTEHLFQSMLHCAFNQAL